MNNKYVLEVSNLSKSFAGTKVVDDVSFKVAAGDVFGFLGPNGAGKTTIIRMILGLIKKDSGTVKINGYDTSKDFNKAINNVGSIVETPSFYDYLSAYENLVQIANLHSNISDKKIFEVLDIVGLSKRANDKVKTYSLGMKQRLGIARALLNKPMVVFLDEPTNGLDPKGMIEIRQLISQLAGEQGITFFITTHMLHDVQQICKNVAILQNGKVIAQDNVNSLLDKEKETVNVHTSEINKALLILKQADFISKTELVNDGITIELTKGLSNELIKLLIANDVKVDYLIPQNQTLEQLFIELTGGNSHV
ncbi:MAG: ABC transporter ATP-binding protein [Bacillota bacterium]|nr:ABC transporter ATP-binding protein [Bacillota bacterium]